MYPTKNYFSNTIFMSERSGYEATVSNNIAQCQYTKDTIFGTSLPSANFHVFEDNAFYRKAA